MSNKFVFKTHSSLFFLFYSLEKATVAGKWAQRCSKASSAPTHHADVNLEAKLSRTGKQTWRQVSRKANLPTADRDCGQLLKRAALLLTTGFLWTPIAASVLALRWFLAASVAIIFTNYFYICRRRTVHWFKLVLRRNQCNGLYVTSDGNLSIRKATNSSSSRGKRIAKKWWLSLVCSIFLLFPFVGDPKVELRELVKEIFCCCISIDVTPGP